MDLQLTPVDTVFFRDGIPFTSGSSTQENVGSLFPPYPWTVTGAIRVALALCNGWDGDTPWQSTITNVIGTGPRDLGKLRVTGPFLLRDGQPVFPVPRHIMGEVSEGRWKPIVCLQPGAPLECDLGTVRLPEASEDVFDATQRTSSQGWPKPSKNWWLTVSGLIKVLGGGMPNETQLLAEESLWTHEDRIGLKRKRTTRTAEEGQLYSTRHVRLANGVSLGVRVDGLPPGWKHPFGQLLPLGGESRFAECHEWELDGLSWSTSGIDQSPTEHIRFAGRQARARTMLVALTPIDLEREAYVGKQSLQIGNTTAKVISACLDRPQRIGGWDSVGRKPMPMRSMLPAGSVLFCEVSDPERLAAASRDGMISIGSRQEWGFGLVGVGRW